MWMARVEPQFATRGGGKPLVAPTCCTVRLQEAVENLGGIFGVGFRGLIRMV
jgi:hypothetical protein